MAAANAANARPSWYAPTLETGIDWEHDVKGKPIFVLMTHGEWVPTGKGSSKVPEGVYVLQFSELGESEHPKVSRAVFPYFEDEARLYSLLSKAPGETARDDAHRYIQRSTAYAPGDTLPSRQISLSVAEHSDASVLFNVYKFKRGRLIEGAKSVRGLRERLFAAEDRTRGIPNHEVIRYILDHDADAKRQGAFIVFFSCFNIREEAVAAVGLSREEVRKRAKQVLRATKKQRGKMRQAPEADVTGFPVPARTVTSVVTRSQTRRRRPVAPLPALDVPGSNTDSKSNSNSNTNTASFITENSYLYELSEEEESPEAAVAAATTVGPTVLRTKHAYFINGVQVTVRPPGAARKMALEKEEMQNLVKRFNREFPSRAVSAADITRLDKGLLVPVEPDFLD